MSSFHFQRLDFFDNLECLTAKEGDAYFPFHFHDSFCISLITRGTEVLETRGSCYFAPAGSISVTMAGEVHRNRSLDKNGYAYRTLYVNPHLLQFFNDGKPVRSMERVIHDPLLFNFLERLITSLQPAPERLWEKALRLLTTHASKQSDSAMFSGRRFSRIDRLIRENITEDLSADWLAAQFNSSKFHFIRQFRKAHGITPGAYITIRKLEMAKQLLAAHVPVYEVAFMNGFCSPSHFTACFRKYYGITPTAYRDGILMPDGRHSQELPNKCLP